MTDNTEQLEDDGLFAPDSHQVVKIFTTDKTSKKYDIYLDDDFDMPSANYRELLHQLSKMTESDVVNIHLASFGGACHVGFQVCHAVKECKGQTKIIIEQPCYSMGAILACCAKGLEMKPGTFLMFHNYSGGSKGKGGEMLAGVRHQDKWLHTSFQYFASPFLTDDELSQLKRDQDIYVHAGDKSLKKRLKRHFSK